MFKGLFLGMIVLALAASPTVSQVKQFEDQRLVAPDGAREDYFGWSVCVCGDVMVAGSPWDDDNGVKSGSAYVFRFDPGSDSWKAKAKLIASGGTNKDYFGDAVSISGGVALIGAYGDDTNGTESGSAYVFRYDPGSGAWNEEAKLLPPSGEDYDKFGQYICVSGDVALIGMPYDNDNGDNAGSAYVFRYDPGSGTWNEEAKLHASDSESFDFFGGTVSLSGDAALIGAIGDDDNGYSAGAAYIFRYEQVSGTWNEEAKLISSDGEPLDHFGNSVSLSENFALIGAHHDDVNGNLSGSAYVFRRDPGSGAWLEEIKLLAYDGEPESYFGNSVSISGDSAVIGAYEQGKKGNAYFFHYDSVSGTWVDGPKLLASDGERGGYFGYSVSISGSTAVVGDYARDSQGYRAGEAYFFSPAPGLDIKCNGLDAGVVVGSTDDVELTIDIDAGNHAGSDFDVWVLGLDPRDYKWSYGHAGSAPQWRFGWNNEYRSGPMYNETATVLDKPLPVGSYKAWLCVDTAVNGHLNIADLLVLDSVSFEVVP